MRPCRGPCRLRPLCRASDWTGSQLTDLACFSRQLLCCPQAESRAISVFVFLQDEKLRLLCMFFKKLELKQLRFLFNDGRKNFIIHYDFTAGFTPGCPWQPHRARRGPPTPCSRPSTRAAASPTAPQPNPPRAGPRPARTAAQTRRAAAGQAQGLELVRVRVGVRVKYLGLLP